MAADEAIDDQGRPRRLGRWPWGPAVPDGMSPPPPEGQSDPHWLREALAIPFVEKARAMVAALWLFMRAPWVFGDSWNRGTAKIPNPLVAMAAAVSILTLLGQESRRALDKDPTPHTLLVTLSETLSPYVMYVALGFIAHFVLRMLGSERKLRTSIGLSLLAGAGPGTLAALGLVVPGVLMVARYGSTANLSSSAPLPARVAFGIIASAAYVYFLFLFDLGLAGAHGLARWKGIAAGKIAVIALAFGCGALEHFEWLPQLTGSIGPHLSIYLGKEGGFIDVKW
jgi:hypothetical protein